MDVWRKEGEPMARVPSTLPDYLRDLNAMKEAEEWMFSNRGVHFSKGYYETHLPRAVGGSDGCWAVVSATAAQRAEAFLRTLGKWDETK